MTALQGKDEFSTPKSVVIMDYGVGNLGSLAGAFRRLNYRVRVSADPAEFADADAVILPGVGAMNSAIETLRDRRLDRVIEQLLEDGQTPLIGICLGMQLMFEHSEEGDATGLGILRGRVRRFADGRCHVGWAVCRYPAGKGSQADGAFYFNHSYYVDAAPEAVTSKVDVDGHGKIAAIVQYRNFVGMQFHPEKSQATGAALLRHVIETSKEFRHA